jgi:hypothetical protein
MTSTTREQIQRTLYDLAIAHATTIKLMEHTLELLGEELALDAKTFWRTRVTLADDGRPTSNPIVDNGSLEAIYQGKRCFLGNTVLYRLIECLSRKPNKYFTYDELFQGVWGGGVRSDSTVRTAIKRLRTALREAGMDELAEAIDGSSPGRYSLRVTR